MRIDSTQSSLDGTKGTLTAAGDNRAIDNNGSPDAASGGRYQLAPFTTPAYGGSDTSLDFGFVNFLEIGDYVWLDDNADGLQQPSEAPLAGVTVQLRDATSGGVLATRITNSTGQYVFSSSDDDLAPLRAHIVSIGLDQAPLARLQPTEPSVGVQRDRDSNGVLQAASESVARPTSPDYGEADYTIDFGFKRQIYLGNFVWRDLDADGVQSSGEPGVAGVSVVLFAPNGTQLASTVTDASGY